MSQLKRGMRVYSLDHRQIGTVGTISEKVFSVLRQSGPPIWVSVDDVYTIAFESVTLIFNASRLALHVVDAVDRRDSSRPPHGGSDTPG